MKPPFSAHLNIEAQDKRLLLLLLTVDYLARLTNHSPTSCAMFSPSLFNSLLITHSILLLILIFVI